MKILLLIYIISCFSIARSEDSDPEGLVDTFRLEIEWSFDESGRNIYVLLSTGCDTELIWVVLRRKGSPEPVSAHRFRPLRPEGEDGSARLGVTLTFLKDQSDKEWKELFNISEYGEYDLSFISGNNVEERNDKDIVGIFGFEFKDHLGADHITMKELKSK